VQPTALGLELDAALEKLLPDLIMPEFTAKMEADLDRIAEGKQDWETYLTQWDREYFGPAIVSAQQQLGAIGNTIKTTPRSFKGGSSETLEQSRFKCPKCDQKMAKVPSKSPKMKAKHFLKCTTLDCDCVMFWNAKVKKYELPYGKQEGVAGQNFTEHPCPVCGALLEQYTYTKEGKEKVMLRCSILDHRREKCKDVAFFETKDGFWSPKFGEMKGGSPKIGG
jgi:DNA topoisomerase I